MEPAADARFKRESQGNSDTRGTQHKSIQMIGKNRARWAGPPQPARLSQASPAQAACSDTTGEGQPRLSPAQLAFVETIPFAFPLLIEFPLFPQSLWQTLPQSTPPPGILLWLLGLPSSLAVRNPHASLSFGPTVPMGTKLQFSGQLFHTRCLKGP